jgi:hypothetical protein
MLLEYTEIVDMVSLLSVGHQCMLKHGRNPCLVIPKEGAEPEVFNVRAVPIAEGRPCKAVNSIILLEVNHLEVKYLIRQTSLMYTCICMSRTCSHC